jgi:lipoprotein-anchoring transpeptidase ErfK/SrfK
MLALLRSVSLPRALVVVACTALALPLATAADAAGATVDTLSPTYGPVGTVVDITGSGLATATDVMFNGIDAGAPTVVDDSHLQATVPSGAHAGVVSVTTKDGTFNGPSFTVQLPTQASAQVSAVNVQFPKTVRVTAALTAEGVPVRGQAGQLQRKVRGTHSWIDTRASKTTGSHGKVRWRVSPRNTTSYRVVFSDSTGYLGTTTEPVRVHVHPDVTLDVPKVAPILTTITMKGTIRPKPQHGRVIIERRHAGGEWQRVTRVPVAGAVHFRFETSFDSTGGYAYRARRAADSTHGAGRSGIHRLQAVQRTLHSGMSGPDVRALQRQLTALHYDVAGVDGSFDFDTQHAVVAFQKVNGLDRDGVVGMDVWKALDDPRKVQLRHPADASTTGIEVDLKHQVLIYAVKGKVRRILDSSTGGGYYYTGSDGTQQRAITPTGHFHIVYKRDGWVTSDLGTLYRPAYFNYSGYAIHGEGEVPNYPASHGCVRITVPAMDRLNAKLPVGLSVWIY